jgi:hypothetical protein
MSDPLRPSHPGLLGDDRLIDAAIARAAREAVLQHARAGYPVATMRDGKVVWIPPEEILARFAAPPAPNGKAEAG